MLHYTRPTLSFLFISFSFFFFFLIRAFYRRRVLLPLLGLALVFVVVVGSVSGVTDDEGDDGSVEEDEDDEDEDEDEDEDDDERFSSSAVCWVRWRFTRWSCSEKENVGRFGFGTSDEGSNTGVPPTKRRK